MDSTYFKTGPGSSGFVSLREDLQTICGIHSEFSESAGVPLHHKGHNTLSELMTIGIAVVENDGQFLVGVRGEDAPLAGHSEFPGGKCKPGESPADAAVRECREETGLSVDTVEFFARHTHAYEHGTVELHFWRCCLSGESAGSSPQNGFRWIPRDQLAMLNFPSANVSVIETLLSQQH